jgi:large subunit ribosomal protein L21e
MRRSLGKFSKRTRCLRKRAGKRSLPMRRLLSSFSVGDKVCIDLAPSQGGMPHPRYRGRHGVIIGTKGDAYVVEVKVGNSDKRLIIPGVHLRRS